MLIQIINLGFMVIDWYHHLSFACKYFWKQTQVVQSFSRCKTLKGKVINIQTKRAYNQYKYVTAVLEKFV